MHLHDGSDGSLLTELVSNSTTINEFTWLRTKNGKTFNNCHGKVLTSCIHSKVVHRCITDVPNWPIYH